MPVMSIECPLLLSRTSKQKISGTELRGNFHCAYLSLQFGRAGREVIFVNSA